MAEGTMAYAGDAHGRSYMRFGSARGRTIRPPGVLARRSAGGSEERIGPPIGFTCDARIEAGEGLPARPSPLHVAARRLLALLLLAQTSSPSAEPPGYRLSSKRAVKGGADHEASGHPP